jgi:superfamily II DNA helicase RecQ
VCNPAGAVLKQFRRATAAERAIAQSIMDELRPVDYKATGSLQRSLELVDRMSRNDFDGLLDAMVRAGAIEIEDAEFEKDGEVIRFHKVRLTAAGRDVRATTPLSLLLADGVVDAFGGGTSTPPRARKSKAAAASLAKSEPLPLVKRTPEEEAAAAQIEIRLKEWRAAEAKRLGVPAYVVLHDRTLTALALARPENARQLLEIDGIGPAKAERFGETILNLCASR